MSAAAINVDPWERLQAQFGEPLSLSWEEIGGEAPREPTTGERFKEIAWLVVSIVILPIGLIRALWWALGWIARQAILPAQWLTWFSRKEVKAAEAEFQQLVNHVGPGGLYAHFIAYRDTVITPDGARLSVKMVVPIEGVADKTLLCFRGNLALGWGGARDWVLSLQKYNLVFFDYRGVGRSTGTFRSPQDLIIDGASVVASIQERLGTRPENIHFYGESLGGGVAAGTQAFREDLTGAHLNQRSFSSIRAVIDAMSLPNWCKRAAAWILEKQGLDFDSVGAIQRLKARGCPLRVSYDPRDQVIREPASLYRGVEEDLGDEEGYNLQAEAPIQYVDASRAPIPEDRIDFHCVGTPPGAQIDFSRFFSTTLRPSSF